MNIWTSIFGAKPADSACFEIRPSGLLMDADGWYYEESLDANCPLRTIHIRQDRPGDWYVRNTNCRVAELNSPARAAEVLDFFIGSFRWLRFEREKTNGRGPDAIRIVGTFLDRDGGQCESLLGYVEQEIAVELKEQDVDRLWGRIRCIRPPGRGRRPTFCLRYDLLVELDEEIFEDENLRKARPESPQPQSS